MCGTHATGVLMIDFGEHAGGVRTYRFLFIR